MFDKITGGEIDWFEHILAIAVFFCQYELVVNKPFGLVQQVVTNVNVKHSLQTQFSVARQGGFPPY